MWRAGLHGEGGPRPCPVASPPGTAGVMVSLSRILTKLLLPDERASTLIFFLLSAGLELLCCLLHLLVRRSRFVRRHTARPRDCRPAGPRYRVHHDVAAGDVRFVSPRPGDRGWRPWGPAHPWPAPPGWRAACPLVAAGAGEGMGDAGWGCSRVPVGSGAGGRPSEGMAGQPGLSQTLIQRVT